mmetsp:Transcript_18754/g.61243  ORF Transcript_18754/g.61243 Transcript_18754/m.61243 type:complete len:104 (+) Transcript_18754:1655-1966(+)
MAAVAKAKAGTRFSSFAQQKRSNNVAAELEDMLAEERSCLNRDWGAAHASGHSLLSLLRADADASADRGAEAALKRAVLPPTTSDRLFTWGVIRHPREKRRPA